MAFNFFRTIFASSDICMPCKISYMLHISDGYGLECGGGGSEIEKFSRKFYVAPLAPQQWHFRRFAPKILGAKAHPPNRGFWGMAPLMPVPAQQHGIWWSRVKLTLSATIVPSFKH